MADFVASCPKNLTEVIKASSSLGCGEDKYGNNQYICLPNIEKTGLVELCHNGIMGIIERGNCLETSEGNLFRSNCSGFLTGCPNDEYHSNEIYKYPACQSINTQQYCYFADRSCRNTTFSSDESTESGNIVWILTAIVFTLIFLMVIAIILRKRRKGSNRRKKDFISSTLGFPEGEGDGPLLEKATGDLGAVNAYETENETLLEQRTHDYKGEVHATDTTVELEPSKSVEEQDKSYRSVGDYSIWKTSLSDLFYNLTDDEVLLLYSFLCSDYGTPDFTNEEWFDILKEIRLRFYRKPVPWTQEEAQRTLEKLKSSEFINVYQEEIHITDEAKDEVMYYVAKRTISYDKVVFKLSNFVTSKRYLRTQGYTRKPGEKCILGVDSFCDSLLTRRLQLDILIHDTMEDTAIADVIFDRCTIYSI